MATLKGTGTEDKKKVAIAAVLGFLVLALAYHTLFGGPATPAPAPAVPGAFVAGTAPGPQSTGPSNASLDPGLHPELMAENENYIYAGTGRDIFSQTSSAPPAAAIQIPKVNAPPRPSMGTVVPVSTGPPPPPAIDLRFFGYAARGNGVRRAFLLHGDDVFVASEGEVVSHRYRIVRIAATSIEIEDLPYHNTQTLPLTQNALAQ